jgi:hypothetical protein
MSIESMMATRHAGLSDPQIADQMVEQAKADGVELVGPGGLLNGLTTGEITGASSCRTWKFDPESTVRRRRPPWRGVPCGRRPARPGAPGGRPTTSDHPREGTSTSSPGRGPIRRF